MSPRPVRIAVAALVGALLVGCTSQTGGASQSTSAEPEDGWAITAAGPDASGGSPQATASSPQTADPSRSPATRSELRRSADRVLSLLRAGDYQALAELVDPTRGVRFTPYLTVDVEGDVALLPEQVAELGNDDRTYTWGAEPGSGDVIETTFAQYAKRFITDQDYANAPVIAENERTGSGSSLDNVEDAYDDPQYVEYHFDGFDDQYGGLDWESLRLVFTRTDGRLRLVGIVHDSWTP